MIFFILSLMPYVLGEKQGCPQSCECPVNVRCPLGTPRVLDTCGCGCEVCAQPLDALCDGLRPCNPAQNLICQYLDLEEKQGVCKVLQNPRSCFLNGREILHGEEFNIHCHSNCKCDNGFLMCSSTCPDQQPPLIPGCKEMQLVTVPGECCPQWKCSEDLDWLMPEWDEDDPTSEEENAPYGKDRMRREAPNRDVTEDAAPANKSSNCSASDTEWTPCSRQCGFGNSVRITYDQESCTPRVERRLCMIRPCKEDYRIANYTVLKSSKRCNRLVRWSEPLLLRHRGCLTRIPLQPKFCGKCSDGRECFPSLSETRPVSFICPQHRRRVTRQMMWVQRCQCDGKGAKKGVGKKGGRKRKEENQMGMQVEEEMGNKVEED
ncbi:CCN family member 5-like [Rhinophrynus dorsalis]